MLALFKSHFSIGKSILTLDDPITHKQGGPDSIFSIAKDNKLKEVILVEDSLTGFLQAQKIAKSMDIKLIFGLRVDMCDDASVDPKTTNYSDRHKIIIFSKNAKGCKLLNNIYSEAFSESFSAVDSDILSRSWNDNNLLLSIPFYDSFIYNNTMRFANCTPNLDFTTPTFLLENNGLPFEGLLRARVKQYAKDAGATTEEAKSIYYKNKNDVEALQAYKCICGRSFGNKTLSKPNLDHFGSNEFCFESWKDQQIDNAK